MTIKEEEDDDDREETLARIRKRARKRSLSLAEFQHFRSLEELCCCLIPIFFQIHCDGFIFCLACDGWIVCSAVITKTSRFGSQNEG